MQPAVTVSPAVVGHVGSAPIPVAPAVVTSKSHGESAGEVGRSQSPAASVNPVAQVSIASGGSHPPWYVTSSSGSASSGPAVPPDQPALR